MATAIIDLSTFGDSRSRDVYNRNLYQGAVSDGINPLEISHVFYGKDTSDTVYELASIKTTETGVENNTGSLDISVNDGSGAAGPTAVSITPTDFSTFTSTVTADLDAANPGDRTLQISSSGSNVVQTFQNAGSNVTVTAAGTELTTDASKSTLTGDLVVQGNTISVFETNGTTLEVPAVQYDYSAGVSGDLSIGTSGLDADGVTAIAKTMTLHTHDDLGANKDLMVFSAGSASGTEETVSITNARLGIGMTPDAAYQLDVTGDARISNDLRIVGSLFVEGTTTTIDATQVQVSDKAIELGYDAAAEADLNGGGIWLGADSGAFSKSLLYDDATKVWDSSIGVNLDTNALEYTIFDGTDTTLDVGTTWNSTGISWGIDSATVELGAYDATTGAGAVFSQDGLYMGPKTAEITIGDPLVDDGMTLTKNSLFFKDATRASISFGTDLTITSAGIESSTASAVEVLLSQSLGAASTWRIAVDDTNADVMVLQYSPDGGTTAWVTKFSVSA